MTVNTLLKEQELGELVDYLRPYYEQGLDAVIVQDIGAMRLIQIIRMRPCPETAPPYIYRICTDVNYI